MCPVEHDELILNCIAKDEKISQRQLARLTDLSLGHLNFLLHKLVKKGFLTIERINSRNLRYILTPQGIARNTRRTYSYIKSAVKNVLLLKDEFEHVLKEHPSDTHVIFIDGEKDEIHQIMKIISRDSKAANIVWIDNTDRIKGSYAGIINAAGKGNKLPVVILWSETKEMQYADKGIEYINLLDRIDK